MVKGRRWAMPVLGIALGAIATGTSFLATFPPHWFR